MGNVPGCNSIQKSTSLYGGYPESSSGKTSSYLYTTQGRLKSDLTSSSRVRLACDAPNPGCPLTTRQPAEIYMSHVMRPIQVQIWPLGPTHPTYKMYILYKNNLFTIVFITIYTK